MLLPGGRIMTAAEWIAKRRGLLDAATEGAWVVGDRDHIHGASFCDCRPEYGPLVWEGRRNINGVEMLTHIHRAQEPRHDSGDTSIYSTSLPYPEVVALSTSEYVSIQPGDAALIVDARTSLPAALDALEAVLAKAQACVDEYGDPVYSGNAYAGGIAAASREIINSVETALRSES